jgi:hypothetical protein
MSIYAIEYEEKQTGEDYIKIKAYIDKVNNNLKSNDLVRNPFTGSVKHYPRENIVVINMKPLYPNPWILTLVALAPILIFKGFVFTYWHIIPLCFLIGSIPHLAWFQYKMFSKGARKQGFNGTLKRIKLGEAIERLL